MSYPIKKVIAEIRRAAKSAGLTFKVDPSLSVNNSPTYKFCVRGGGEAVMWHCTLSSAYSNVLSGYISSWDGHNFAGVNQYA